MAQLKNQLQKDLSFKVEYVVKKIVAVLSFQQNVILGVVHHNGNNSETNILLEIYFNQKLNTVHGDYK